MKHYPTLYQISETHAWKRDYEKYLPFSRYVYRPAGFLVTWIAIRLGMTTEMASYFSAILGITGLLFLVSKNESLIIGAIILLHLFNLFDCVDGSIARATKTENPYGKFLDSIIGDAINFAFFAFVGIMLYRHPDLALSQTILADLSPNLWIIIGGGTALSFILLQHIESIYDAQLRAFWNSLPNEKTLNGNELVSEELVKEPEERLKSLANLIRLIDRNFRVRETHYFILIFAFWLRFIDVFLVFFLFYCSIRLVATAVLFGRRALTLKRRQRGASLH